MISSFRRCARIGMLAAVLSFAFECGAGFQPASDYGKLPLVFEPNHGQAAAPVRFLARAQAYTVLVTDDAAVIRAPGMPAVVMRFIGGAGDARLEAEQPMASRSHYFLGADPKAHITDVPNFGAVKRSAILPGVDVRFYGNQRELEYDFVVAPGADASSIRIGFEGVDAIEMSPDGDLVLRVAGRELIQRKAIVYQPLGAGRKLVDAEYEIEGNEVRVRVAEYDRRLALVIDPVVVYGGRSGGSSNSYAVAIDAAGNAYVAGQVVQSTGFPTVSAFDATIAHNDVDAYVQKINPAGTAFVYSTYLGGKGGVEQAVGIAVDSGGNAYVTGTTSGIDFPVSATAYQRTAPTGGGSFISKLGPAGNALVYSTYLLNATATAIAVDAAGNAYVTGQATAAFATTAGAFQPAPRTGAGTGFVFKLNVGGTAPAYSTFLGGNGEDMGRGIAVDGAGNAYVAGRTSSTDFPAVNAIRSTFSGVRDAFVTRVNTTGTALDYSTYLGGSDDDYANAIAVDAKGFAYVTGVTASFNFPVVNAFQPVKGGVNIQGTIDNAFVAKLRPDGAQLVYSSFLGGNACIGPGSDSCFITHPVDAGTSIAIDPQGNAYVGGQTQSMSFPLVDSLQPAPASNGDGAFLAKISKRGGLLLYSSIVGGQTGIGNPQDYVRGLAADGNGNVYGTGNIAGFPASGPLAVNGGAVVFKMASGPGTLSLASSVNPATSGQATTITATVAGATLAGNVLLVDGTTTLASAALANGVATFNLTPGVGIRQLTAVYRNGATEIESPLLYQVTHPQSCN